jgi:hypothetical protein
MERKSTPRGRTKLDTDSLQVQTFEAAPAPTQLGQFDSIDITCAVLTQWVCGTRRGACPAC